MSDMSQKMDLLLNTALESRAPISHSTPQRVRHTSRRGGDDEPARHTGARHITPVVEPPRRLRHTENHDGYVDQCMEKERFTHNGHSGKPSHDNCSAKPYMYIEREECQTDKQRLDVRCVLGPLEYILATLALLMDPESHDKNDHSHIMVHLHDVTRDAMEREWLDVRRWSQYVWDSIVDKGRFEWADTRRIQNERVRLAMTGGGGSVASGPRTQQQARSKHNGKLREVVCREFNTTRGCSQGHSHDDGVVKYNHVCSYCDSVNRHCPGHNMVACDRKIQHYENDERRRFEQPPPHTHQQYMQYPRHTQAPAMQFPYRSRAPSGGNQAFPKNA